MRQNYSTKRLLLRSLDHTDTAFILELVNTDGWLKFIGDRNVHDETDAGNYIQKILNNLSVRYWVVALQDSALPIGLVTFIKRDYLDHHDIGFAFLPAFHNQGYALEASQVVLDDLLKPGRHSTIVATTIPDNHSSVKLLKKLGFSFSKTFSHDNLTLNLFSISI